MKSHFKETRRSPDSVDVNLWGPFLCSRAVVPGMVARHGDRIITTASGAGTEPWPFGAAYAIAKGAAICDYAPGGTGTVDAGASLVRGTSPRQETEGGGGAMRSSGPACSGGGTGWTCDQSPTIYERKGRF